MIGWLKRKLENLGERHMKIHYRLIGAAEREQIEITLGEKVRWQRGHTKKGHYYDAAHTQSQIKQATGKPAVFLNGQWYEVTYESNSI